ncbi:MAG TPA: hypothetical protein PLX89_23300 [Verrucomicrobiota bacterium]|nr:hypothetical protein [Verrucomicrobiales bacterium]HRI15936.1 hypothetical protein [Verrucomicrobiota bacterium]
MTPDLQQPCLARQSWFTEFLAAHGFQRTSDSSFSNGRATLQIEGSVLLGVPAPGGKGWRSNLAEANPETARTLLSQLLASSYFRSQAKNEEQALAQRKLHVALTGIAEAIREGAETHSGAELRKFLWSLFNGHHEVNLWRFRSNLDSRRSAWVVEVFAAAMNGTLRDDDLRLTLSESGEAVL